MYNQNESFTKEKGLNMLDILFIFGVFCAVVFIFIIMLYGYVVYTSPFVEHSFIDFVKVFFKCLFKKPSDREKQD